MPEKAQDVLKGLCLLAGLAAIPLEELDEFGRGDGGLCLSDQVTGHTCQLRISDRRWMDERMDGWTDGWMDEQ